MNVLLAALLVGIACGMRTMTGPAVVFFSRGPALAIVLGLAAIGEYVADVLPQTPSRLKPIGLAARTVTSGVCGYALVHGHGHGLTGAALGIIGAAIGAFGGHAARIVGIKKIGNRPAGLAESAVALVLALVAVLVFA